MVGPFLRFLRNFISLIQFTDFKAVGWWTASSVGSCQPQAPKRAREHHHSWHRGKDYWKENTQKMLTDYCPIGCWMISCLIQLVDVDVLGVALEWCCLLWFRPVAEIPWSTHWRNHDSQMLLFDSVCIGHSYSFLLITTTKVSIYFQARKIVKVLSTQMLSLCLGIPINTRQNSRTNVDS